MTFSHLPASTARELAGHPVTAAITTFYMLSHVGDQISFLADASPDWPFSQGSFDDLAGYRDATEGVIEALLQMGILLDEGREIFWPDEPEVYIRRLRNIWLERGSA